MALEAADVIFAPYADADAGLRLGRQEGHKRLTRELKTLEAEAAIANAEAEPPKTPKGGVQRLEHAHKRVASTAAH